MTKKLGRIAAELLGVELPPEKTSEEEKKRLEELEDFKKEYNDKVMNPPEPKKLRPLTMEERKAQFFKAAAQIIGSKFIVNDENKPILNALFWYFSNNEKFNQTTVTENQPSLSKGLLLMGNTGSGKTTFIDIFQLLKWEFGFRKFSIYDVVEDFEKEGEKGITTYFRGIICFDDLGAESEAVFYGKRENVGTRLLEKRYNSWRVDGLRTFITTNMNLEELVDNYGFRMEGRFKESYNIIKLGAFNNSNDFRENENANNNDSN